MSVQDFWSITARKFSLAVSSITIIAAVGVAFSTFTLFFKDDSLDRLLQMTPDAYLAQLQDHQRSLDRLRRDLEALSQQQRALRQSIEQPSQNRDIASLSGRLDDISQRQERIEQVILNNPARALEIPMLRNDLNNMREANAQRLEAIKASVDQSYDLNKWLLGTMAITIIGLAITTFLSRKT